MEYSVTVSGMHCESCEKIIERAVGKREGARVVGINHRNNQVTLVCTEEQLNAIRKELAERGYSLLLPGEEASGGFEAGSFGRGLEYLYRLISGQGDLTAENRLLKCALATLAAIGLAQGILILTIFREIPDYLTTYWSVTLLTGVSVVALVFAYYQASAFRQQASCMTGMMIGMTFGMAAGFLFGAFAGATNGMFTGSLVGMAVGMGLGYITGRCCGVMGVMEGLMGGLMAGTMGAMLSVMLIYNNLVPFLFILTGVELAILVAFSYMLYKEHGQIKGLLSVNGLEFAVFSILLDLFLTAVYVFGPKAGVVLGA